MAKILFPQKGRTIYSGDSALKLHLFHGSCRTAGTYKPVTFKYLCQTGSHISKITSTAKEDSEMYVQKQLTWNLLTMAETSKPVALKHYIILYQEWDSKKVLLVESSKIFAIWGVWVSIEPISISFSWHFRNILLLAY